MKFSGIGGQAVMEGVMMRNGKKYAVAVRRPDHEIEVKVEEKKGTIFPEKLYKIPMLRGVLSFIDSLVLGLSTLMYSASFFDEEEEPEPKKEKESRRKKEKEPKPKKEKDPEKEERAEKIMMGGTLVISIIICVAVFMILPYYLSQLFQRVVSGPNLIAVFEGVLRLAIFLVYILLISRMKDIQRVFMYHGAEHKCINCVENGLDLTVENVRGCSKEHKRCGTSFLVFVIVITIILYMFIRVDSHAMRLLIRLILIPVIAGLSFELLQLAGRSDNKFIRIISRPGFWVQAMTVREPDDEMIEVGIASVEAVFDWKTFVEKVRQEEGISCPAGCGAAAEKEKQSRAEDFCEAVAASDGENAEEEDAIGTAEVL